MPGSKGVLVVSQDAGGAQALVPVVQRLAKEQQVRLSVLARAWAAEVLCSHGIAHQAVPSQALWWGGDFAERVLQRHRPQLVLAGTSWGPAIEKPIIEEARRQGIRSLALLDFWSNYWQRFSDLEPGGKFRYLPDRIAVMDHYARKEMVAEGFPKRCLVVTGQPYLDALAANGRDEGLGVSRRRLLQLLNLPAEASLVTFVSQPLAELYGTDSSSPSFLGFTEYGLFASLLQGLAEVGAVFDRPLCLIIKSHPREGAGKYGSLLAGLSLRVVADPAVPPRHLVEGSDVVVGVSSMLLVESFLLGRPTFSLQPSLITADPFVLTRRGLLPAIRQVEAIAPTILQALQAPCTKGDEACPTTVGGVLTDGGATARVVRLVYQLLGLPVATPLRQKG